VANTRAVFFRNQTGLARGCKLFNPRDTSKLDAVLRALEEDLVLALAGERARTLYDRIPPSLEGPQGRVRGGMDPQDLAPVEGHPAHAGQEHHPAPLRNSEALVIFHLANARVSNLGPLKKTQV